VRDADAAARLVAAGPGIDSQVADMADLASIARLTAATKGRRSIS